MATKAKKTPAKRSTIGKPPQVNKTKVAIYNATTGKMVYMAKYTVFNLDPALVHEAIRAKLSELQKTWEDQHGSKATTGSSN